MQYFIDKLKEFLVFLVFSRLVQGVVTNNVLDFT